MRTMAVDFDPRGGVFLGKGIAANVPPGIDDQAQLARCGQL